MLNRSSTFENATYTTPRWFSELLWLQPAPVSRKRPRKAHVRDI